MLRIMRMQAKWKKHSSDKKGRKKADSIGSMHGVTAS